MKFKVESMLLEIIFIMKNIFSVVSGKCEGSPLDLSPNASTPEVFHITSPHYPNEYNKTADCEWTISGTGYIYEISFVEKVLHFQDPYGRNYCSGSYVIAVNGEDIDCLWPTDPEMLCFAYQQPSCGEPQIDPKCQSNTYHNDTFRLTYKSDGRTSDKQNVTGFNLTIKVTKCPSEANSTDVPTPTATSPHPYTHSISTITTEPPHQWPARKPSTPSHSGDVTATTERHHQMPIHENPTSSQSEDDDTTGSTGSHHPHTHNISTATESEAQPPSTTLEWQTIVIAMGAGFGFLFIAMIALFLYLLYRRSNTSPPESQQPPNSEVTEMQPPPEPYYATPYEPPLSNSAQYDF